MATIDSEAPVVSVAYHQRIEDVVAALGTDALHGLTDLEARTRLLRDGRNELAKRDRSPPSICPHDCPYDAPKARLQSQQQPRRSTKEVEISEGFTRKIEEVREADFRLANRRLQPLGHLTATRELSIRRPLTYAEVTVLISVPEIVPVNFQNRAWKGDAPACGLTNRMQRSFSKVIVPPSRSCGLPSPDEFPSTSSVGLARGTTRVPRIAARTFHEQAAVS